MDKVVKVKTEWCENWIKTLFEKHYPEAKSITTGLFWELAEKSGLYKKGTYNSPMSQALKKLADYEIIRGENGEFLYDIFKLKK